MSEAYIEGMASKSKWQFANFKHAVKNMETDEVVYRGNVGQCTSYLKMCRRQDRAQATEEKRTPVVTYSPKLGVVTHSTLRELDKMEATACTLRYSALNTAALYSATTKEDMIAKARAVQAQLTEFINNLS